MTGIHHTHVHTAQEGFFALTHYAFPSVALNNPGKGKGALHGLRAVGASEQRKDDGIGKESVRRRAKGCFFSRFLQVKGSCRM